MLSQMSAPDMAHDHMIDLLSDHLPAFGEPVELSAVGQQLELTRFSGGRVHQNVVDVTTRLWVRAWAEGGAGYAVSSNLDENSIADAIAKARTHAARVQAEPIDLPGSASLRNDPYFTSTAEYGPEARVESVSGIHEAVGADVAAHGNIRVASQSHALVNSAGLRTGFKATYAALNLVAQSDGRATGYAGAIGRDVDTLDFIATARRAGEMARQGRRPVVVPPGRYEVLLDPPAVSMLLVSLGYVGMNVFGAVAARAKDAWFKPGKIVASTALNLRDDPHDQAALFSPIDAEGVHRSPFDLITRGAVVGVAHDLTSAKADGTVTTGHALPPGDKGPAPHSLSIAPGSTSRDELIRGIKRGLVVNRIHPFVSLRGGVEGELSGTTRDGVFLVENGEIVAPVANVRWSNSMSDLFRSVEAVSAERSVEFMDLPELSPHTCHVPSLYSTHFTVHGAQPRER